MIKRNFIFIAILIAAIALFARYQVSSELFQNDPAVTRPLAVTDMATYMELSEKISDGKFKGEFYFQPFYYAVFLPLCHLVLGKSVWAVIVAQMILSSLTVYMAIILASLLAGRRAGIIAGLLTAFSSILIFYVPYHLIETLQAFLISLLLLVSLYAVKRKKLYLWAIAGVVAGCAILARGNVWFLVPGIFIVSFLAMRSTNRRLRFSTPFIFLAAVIIPQIPFSVINTCVLGKFCGPSTAGPAVIALGNTPEAPPGGRNPDAGPGPMEYPDTYKAWMASQDQVPVIKRIMNWSQEEPAAFLELQFRKLLLFWDGNEIPNNIDISFNGIRSKSLRLFGFLTSPMILSLGLAGFLVGLMAIANMRKLPARLASSIFISHLLLWYFIAAFWFATAAFYNLTRFRLAIFPLLAVSAGFFVARMTFNYRMRNWRTLLYKYFGVLFASLVIVGMGYFLYRIFCESAMMRIARPHGVHSDLGTSLLVMDNGPYSFGGWQPHDLKTGDELIKIFDVEPGGETAKFAMPVIFKNRGRAVFSVNGTNVTVESEKAGFTELAAEIRLVSDKVSVKLEETDSPLIVLLDAQRDYGRTRLNGYMEDSELVSRIYIEMKSEGTREEKD